MWLAAGGLNGRSSQLCKHAILKQGAGAAALAQNLQAPLSHGSTCGQILDPHRQVAMPSSMRWLQCGDMRQVASGEPGPLPPLVLVVHSSLMDRRGLPQEGGSFWSPQKRSFWSPQPGRPGLWPDNPDMRPGQPGHVARTPGHLARWPGAWPGCGPDFRPGTGGPEGPDMSRPGQPGHVAGRPGRLDDMWLGPDVWPDRWTPGPDTSRTGGSDSPDSGHVARTARTRTALRPGHAHRWPWPGQPGHVADGPDMTAPRPGHGSDGQDRWLGRTGHVRMARTCSLDGPDMWPGQPGHVARTRHQSWLVQELICSLQRAGGLDGCRLKNG